MVTADNKWTSPDGCVTLYRGDCLEILPTLAAGSVDAVVTDPPFAITGGLSNGMTSRTDTQFFEHWFADVSREFIRTIKPEGCWFLWCDWRTLSSFDRAISKASERYDPWWISQVITHNREMIGMGSPFRNQCDWVALVRGKKTDFNSRIPNNQPNIINSYSYYGKHDNHPAEKTTDVASMFVRWAAGKGGLIIDPFMGSGTTGISAVQNNRKFIGIERDPDYFDTAVQRIERATAASANGVQVMIPEQSDLFAMEPQR